MSVVDRISLVLEALSTGPMTLAKVTARTGLPRSSAHRLLEQLANAGWLARSPEQTYEFGVKAYELGQAALNQNRLLHHARPLMHAFAHRSGFTVQLGVVDRGDTVYLAKVNGRTSGSTPTAVGQRVPAHSTALGKVIMAYSAVSSQHRPDRDRIASGTAPSARSRFEDELAQVRDRGAAFDRAEAFPGIACVGVSIGPPDHMYGNLAGLSVCAPVSVLDHHKMIGPLRVLAGDIWQRCVASDLSTH
ncbi:IclR family transcriptional regulator [Rhodococcus rhodochrous]|uniref:IclR family transcriptional regulator n=1 Tax=Rhodococcus rhodochrous TaxID=1829 RepID=UPI000B5A97E4|nr:IclR family transcriptional regulator [Rhodococcus rhodochrous]OWY80265.1 transcriptional regulator [Rhodococcus sp. BUPNP1]QHG84917.1 IclR family transcriptional regulator [Rhodococcus rhodochrous]QOH58026.1 IclR family transcriptional regulator [Rhodococcus rhodochrous]